MANDRPNKRDTPLPLEGAGDEAPGRPSQELIYESIMRGGGEPFGAPFEIGVSTLTEKIVKRFKQSGFFNFETMEKLRRKNRRNKFTRYGAAPYLGEYQKPKRRK